MKFAWRNTIPDLAAWNSSVVEEIDISEYEGLLGADDWQNDFDRELDDELADYDTMITMIELD